MQEERRNWAAKWKEQVSKDLVLISNVWLHYCQQCQCYYFRLLLLLLKRHLHKSIPGGEIDASAGVHLQDSRCCWAAVEAELAAALRAGIVIKLLANLPTSLGVKWVYLLGRRVAPPSHPVVCSSRRQFRRLYFESVSGEQKTIIIHHTSEHATSNIGQARKKYDRQAARSGSTASPPSPTASDIYALGLQCSHPDSLLLPVRRLSRDGALTSFHLVWFIHQVHIVLLHSQPFVTKRKRRILLFLLHSTSRSFFYLFLLEPRNRTTSLSNKPLKVISYTVESFRIDRHLDGEEKKRNRHSRVDSSTGLLEAFRVPEKRGNGVKVSSVSTSLFFFFFSSYKSLLSIQSVATFKRAVATSIDPTLKKVTSICCHLPPFPSFFCREANIYVTITTKATWI